MTEPERDPRVVFAEDGAPRSGRFDDVYFSSFDGLAESRAVYLAGCGLPEAWAGRKRFCVGELGFGAGLNQVALLDLWRRTRPDGARLASFSVEAFLLDRASAARALAAFPEVAEVAEALLAQWPKPRDGFHRFDFPQWGATLDLALMPVETALARWSGAADAWMLDGFSPAKNPEMWSAAVMRAVARRSRPGARAATFTVASAVRTHLAAAGFAVAKRPGFGRKRERLEAVFPGAAADPPAATSVIVIGAGLAGALTVRALRRLGVEAHVLSQDPPASGASGNPAGLTTFRLDAGGGAAARLYADAFARAISLYAREVPGAIFSRGVVQLEAVARDAARFDKIARSPLFPAGDIARLSPEAAAARLGEPCPGGLWLAEALSVSPAKIIAAALNGVAVRREIVAMLSFGADGVTARGAGGEVLARADAAVIAAGAGSGALSGLAFEILRGQTSYLPGLTFPAASFGAYIAPAGDGVVFGATHDRGDADLDVRGEDHLRNRRRVAQTLPQTAERLDLAQVQGFAGLRVSVRDKLPVAGLLRPNLAVLSGLGGRGLCAAPLLAEHVAAVLAGAPSPLAEDLARLAACGRPQAALESPAD